MRTIKFRGKRVNRNGEWVYGDLRQLEDRCLILLTGADAYKVGIDAYWVQEETICQYTGLKDINDKEIYEGDVVDWNFTYQSLGENFGVEFRDTIVRGIVKWHQGGFILEVVNNDFENAGFYGISALNTDTESDVEIIGNIHDNIELLTKTNNNDTTE